MFDKAAKQLLFLTLTEKLCLLNVNLDNGTPSTEVIGELSLNKVNIEKVSHCDGLLLCTIEKDPRIVVWNPCTGQTKWIQRGKNHCTHFVLGFYQDNKSCDKSYKILSNNCFNGEFDICDINYNSWRKLDVTLILYLHFVDYGYSVSLKGKSYWFAYDSSGQYILISFDYTTERFEHLSLPCHEFIISFWRELSMLLQRRNTSRGELWVAKKIDDETKEMSWSKLLEVEVGIRHD
ncbi:putative F-box protein [Cardamine amara subsp. amara]|uniref:F-box protein n=1 Tax=Cardamine amara subsp. amara TaxID=228776 RepID=A0ABD1A885_CARAN